MDPRSRFSRRYEESKALAAEKGEVAVEAVVDGILEEQLHEVEEARALYRRRDSAAMTVRA
jgi:hypothetical protein